MYFPARTCAPYVCSRLLSYAETFAQTAFSFAHTSCLLDHIYTNQYHKKIHSGTIVFSISDHHPSYPYT